MPLFLTKKINLKQTTFWLMIFGLPLVFYFWGYDMYEVPKNVFFKICLSVILISYGIEILIKKKISLITNKYINYSILVFLLILVLSLIFALRPQVSFWGSFFRQGGVINMLHYIALFLVGLQILNTKKNRIFFLKIVSLSGLLVSLYAIVQKIGFDIFPSSVTAVFAGRSFASMGNPTVLGAFLIFPLYTQISLLVSQKKKPKNIIRNIVIIFILLTAIFLTKNRATILALLAIGFLELIYYFRKYKKIIIGGLLTLAILSSLFIGFYGKDLRSLHSRFSIWHTSVEILKENPITGYGAESFSLAFERHVNKNFFLYEDYYNLSDRPHNELLEMWIHFGLLGLLFYVFIIGICVKQFFSTKDPTIHFMSAGLLTLFASNFFSFSLTIHYIFIALSLAFILATSAKKKVIKSNILSKLIAVIVILLMLANIGLNVALFYSNQKLKQSYNAVVSGKFNQAIGYIQQTLKWSPQYYEIYSIAFNNIYIIALNHTSSEIINTALAINNQFKNKSLFSLKSLLNETKVLILAGKYDKAEKVFKEIYQIKADHPLIYEEWADMYMQQKNYQKAAVIYDELLKLMPPDWQAPLLSGGKMTEKQRIFWKNHPDFIDVLKNMSIAYEFSGQSKKAEMILNSLQ